MYHNFEFKSTIYFAGAVLVLTFLTGLGTGVLLKNGESSPIIIDKNAKIGLPPQPEKFVETGGGAVYGAALGNFSASINGKAYYPKNCAGAGRIKEENKIWFDTKEEAEAEGYKPAQNCSW